MFLVHLVNTEYMEQFLAVAMEPNTSNIATELNFQKQPKLLRNLCLTF